MTKLAPTTAILGYHGDEITDIPLDFDLTKCLINGKYAVWNGHEFELIISYGEPQRGINGDVAFYLKHNSVYEYNMQIYYPLDHRLIEADILGATRAYENEFNDGWLFAHCDADFHIDHEYRLLAAVTTAFEAEMQRAEKVFRDAVYDAFLVNDRGNQAAVTGFNRMQHNLSLFREDVKAALLTEARSRPLGYYQQNPHEAHIHEPLERAIRAVIPKWDVENRRLLEWNPIQTYVNGVLAKVTKRHLYETRWGQAARLKAEAEAAMSSGERKF